MGKSTKIFEKPQYLDFLKKLIQNTDIMNHLFLRGERETGGYGVIVRVGERGKSAELKSDRNKLASCLFK